MPHCSSRNLMCNIPVANIIAMPIRIILHTFTMEEINRVLFVTPHYFPTYVLYHIVLAY